MMSLKGFCGSFSSQHVKSYQRKSWCHTLRISLVLMLFFSCKVPVDVKQCVSESSFSSTIRIRLLVHYFSCFPSSSKGHVMMMQMAFKRKTRVEEEALFSDFLVYSFWCLYSEFLCRVSSSSSLSFHDSLLILLHFASQSCLGETSKVPLHIYFSCFFCVTHPPSTTRRDTLGMRKREVITEKREEGAKRWGKREKCSIFLLPFSSPAEDSVLILASFHRERRWVLGHEKCLSLSLSL